MDERNFSLIILGFDKQMYFWIVILLWVKEVFIVEIYFSFVKT